MDVACVGKSRTKKGMAPTCWEVKTSRSDFRSDVTKGKYERYLPFVSRLYFATPAGVLKREDIPPRMGWATRNENGWSVIKAPHLSHPETEGMLDFMVALVLNREQAPWRREKSRRERAEALDREDLQAFFSHWPDTGRKVNRLLQEGAKAQREYKNVREMLMERLVQADAAPGNPKAKHWTLAALLRRLLEARPHRPPTEILSVVEGVRLTLERQAKRLREIES